ncbi:MAG: tryptophanase [candidate division Zixibacteria bacterium]|nr:tryptophanase [candidate division Zixibacteria bacterium]
MKRPIEPFRIKMTEPISLPSEKERVKYIEEAGYNIFKIRAQDIFVDFLTDSGTGAMSQQQWAGIMNGDESYAGGRNWFHFEETVKDIFQKKYVLPCHQGRVAENLFFSSILKKGDYVPNNTHFDTTRANTMHKGGIPVDLPCKELNDDSEFRFKGNFDTEGLESFINKVGPDKVPVVVITVTNNSVGGLGVSMQNVKEVRRICDKYKLLLFFDAARFAENSYFIKKYEPGYEDHTIKSVAQEMLGYGDGAMMSAKKDGMANMGGFLAVNDAELAGRLKELLILIEGFPTYGGLNGRDLEAIAIGLKEALNEEYLAYRTDHIAYFGEILQEAGCPIISPTGGHAVFLDAGKLLPHIPAEQFPGQSLTVELYRKGAIRAVEIGSLMFGGEDPNTGEKFTAKRELVRLAVPRRMYTVSHLEYTAEIVAQIVKNKGSLKGYKIVEEPKYLRHFTCRLQELVANPVSAV